jgi:hypothetical protein
METSAGVQALFFVVISLLCFSTSLACIGRRQKGCFTRREENTILARSVTRGVYAAETVEVSQ